MTILGIFIGILVVLAITALTGYFVAQEFAYMAVDRSRLAVLAEAGDSAASRALAVTKRTSFMLSGAQLGITVTGLLVGYVAEPLIGAGVGDLLGGIGVPIGVGIAIGTVLAVLFSTVVQMVFGELFPKNLSIARPEPVALRLALSTTIYLKLFGWLIRLFDGASNLFLRALRIEPVHDVEHSATPRDLEHIVADSRDAGELPEHLSTLLDRILDFPTHSAEHAMMPRSRVDTVSAETPASELLTLMSRGHTRYPVIGDSTEDLRGIVNLTDVLQADSGTTAADLAKPAVVVPETLPLPEVLTRLTEADQQMALVIDEYGGFAGAVTIEDMAEEVVGEIADEHDTDAAGEEPVRRVAGGWLVRGDAHLDEVERAVDELLPAGDYETISGLFLTNSGRLPDPGDSVRVPCEPDPGDLVTDDEPERKELTLVVREVQRRVPSLVYITVGPVTETDEEVTR